MLGEFDDRVATVRADPTYEYRSAPALVNVFCYWRRGRQERSRDRLTEQVDITLAQTLVARARRVDEMHRLTNRSLELAPF